MMKKLNIITSILFVFIISSCGGETDNETTDNADMNELEKVEGGKFSGGVLKLNSIEDFTSLFPASVNDIYSTHIASQGYEGLLRLNQKTLEVEPCIAESFQIDNDKKVYTFKIRQGVKFVDDECFEGGKGRVVNANDFKYCYEFLCSNHVQNKWSSLFRYRIVGAEDYASGNAAEVSGIRVIDDFTLEIELIDAYSVFPNLLAISATFVYPKEAIDKYDYDGMQNRIVGSGPFIAEKIENGTEVIFSKNPGYWREKMNLVTNYHF